MESAEDFKRRKRADQERYRYNNKRNIRLRYLKRRYGITIEQYDTMVEKQGGLCAICGKPPNGRWKRLAVDHCHKTGKVRGLLCHACNVLLGHAEDNWEVLCNAVRYLVNAARV
jgi:hypothetical protein